MEQEPRHIIKNLLPRAYYSDDVELFLAATPDEILGKLTSNSEFAVELGQKESWRRQIVILKTVLRGLAGTLFMEFNIPRMGKRVDAVLIAGAIVFVMEFKVGEDTYRLADLDQVWDYCLDLKNFHQGSHQAELVPILIATDAKCSDTTLSRRNADGVYAPVRANEAGLRTLLDLGLRTISGSKMDGLQWGQTPYHPTPTIIEAAQALYASHSVDAVARHDAGARNLSVTSAFINELVDEAKRNSQKTICLVTGVPGAGKTLVGLNVATKRMDREQPTHAVFLSGNGPLVEVLREALTRDEVTRRKNRGERVKKGTVGEKIKAFIQNVHHFRDDALRSLAPPIDHVVIFDEAQRAWNKEMTANFMRRKKNLPDFPMSEPEFLISCLDRHKDWAVIVCLVGGGQEINTGEAGIAAWLDALNSSYPEWRIHISPELLDSEYSAGRALDALHGRPEVYFNKDLHLAVSMRSFRAENVSAFIKAILDGEIQIARDHMAKLRGRYPIVLTRDLSKAKRWILDHARGSERYGLVASSAAHRLKPYAVDIRVETNPVHWFLNDKDDTRSSCFLEDAATEFQVQGLEVDWACVTWDGDFRFAEGGWSYHSFRGSKWDRILKADRRNYLRNAYRVLLTRARQGMVIFVPDGVASDPTRIPAFYDTTYEYLRDVGIPVLSA